MYKNDKAGIMYIEEKAYAKINLILNVLDKRTDGFHEVDFVMGTVGIYDLIKIERSDFDQVECVSNNFIKKEKNLAYLAWLLMKEEFNINACISIKIIKNIPISAGMAGGSADAAAVLRAVNKLFDLNCTLDELAMIGAKLGSDVPFCVYQTNSRARGRGEKIELLSGKIPPLFLVVINPNVPLSTVNVYQNHKIGNKHGYIDKLIDAKTTNELIISMYNDLEKTAIELEPRISEIKLYIGQKFDNKMIVSGSGPTVLVLCDTKEHASEVYSFASEKYKLVYQTELRG